MIKLCASRGSRMVFPNLTSVLEGPYNNNVKGVLKRLCQSAQKKLKEIDVSKKALPFDKLKLENTGALQINKDDYVDFRKYVYPESEGAYIVFINGYYRSELSDCNGLPEEVKVMTLEEGWRSYKSFLKGYFSRRIKKESHPWVLQALAGHTDALFVYVGAETQVSKTLQVINLITQSSALAQPLLVSFLGEGAKMKMSVENIFLAAGFSNLLQEQIISDNAYLECYSITKNGGYGIESIRSALSKGATMKSVSFTKNSKEQAFDYEANLNGEGAEAFLYGNWQLQNSSRAHYNVVANHFKEKTVSKQHFKGVLEDESVSSFSGKIYIDREGQKVNAEQLNNNLLMSDEARAYSKPFLEIFADDVKATHGATFGSLDEETLFYFKSRGVDEYTARRLLVKGFNREIIENIKIGSLQSQII